jgi:hypothetical protein
MNTEHHPAKARQRTASESPATFQQPNHHQTALKTLTNTCKYGARRRNKANETPMSPP